MNPPDTGYHAPIVLAEVRERRARRQRPYPAVNDYTPPTAAEIAAADEKHDIARANRWVRVLVVLAIAPLVVALGTHLYFR